MPPPLFLRPSRPPLPPPRHHSLHFPVSFLTAPIPPLRPLALTSSPLLLSIRGPSLCLSSPNVFIVAVFSRDSSLFAVCPCIASSLPRALRTKRARARALLSALLENVLTTSVLLFLRRSARLLSRARTLFCHYSLCFLRSTILFSLPSLLPASQFFHRRFPFPAIFRSCAEWRSPRFSRNSESRLRPRTFFFSLFFILFFFVLPSLFPSPPDIPLYYGYSTTLYLCRIRIFLISLSSFLFR